MKKSNILFCLLLLLGCKKESNCKTYTADTYCVPKQSGITPCTPGVVTFEDCTPHNSGDVILYHEDTYMKYYRKIR